MSKTKAAIRHDMQNIAVRIREARTDHDLEAIVETDETFIEQPVDMRR